jgi:5-formyltetrahydrofolate cyclo-ligase
MNRPMSKGTRGSSSRVKNLNKEELRKKYKKIRDGLPVKYQREASSKISTNVLKIPELKKSKAVGIYLSKTSEVRTYRILEKLFKLKKIVAVPKVHKKNNDLSFHQIKSLKDCRLSDFNILEPISKCPKIPLSKIDFLLVPGIAFDRHGHRLGYGKGFYDQFLKESNVFAVGLTYEKTLLKKLPAEKRDIPVSCIVTEKNVYPVKNLGNQKIRTQR